MAQIVIKVPRNIACVSNTFSDKSFGGKAEVLSNIKCNGKHCQHFYTMFYVIIAIQKQSQTTDGVSVVFPVITLRFSAITMDWLWKVQTSSYLVESCSQLTLQQGRWFFLPCCILHVTDGTGITDFHVLQQEDITTKNLSRFRCSLSAF